jgi:hypothetical protein
MTLSSTCKVLVLASAGWALTAGANTPQPAKPKVQQSAAKPQTAQAARVAKVAPVATAGAVAAAAAPKPLEPLGDAELAIAANVYVGVMPCELGQSVEVQADPAAPGHFHLRLKQERFHLRPVVSSSGAVRLEDPAKGAVWIQLANKSMLMSQKLGRRLVDECMGPVQQAMAEQLKRNPAPHLLDVAQSPRLN